MWQPLVDCAKQLTIHSRLREKLDNDFKLYEIIAVEFDQFHLQLIKENDTPGEGLNQTLNCKQLIQYKFEVEMND